MFLKLGVSYEIVNCLGVCLLTAISLTEMHWQFILLWFLLLGVGSLLERLCFKTLTLLTSLPCFSGKDLTSVCQSAIAQITLVDKKLSLKKVYTPFLTTSIILCMWPPPPYILYSKISEVLNSTENWVQHFEKAGHSFIHEDWLLIHLRVYCWDANCWKLLGKTAWIGLLF